MACKELPSDGNAWISVILRELELSIGAGPADELVAVVNAAGLTVVDHDAGGTEPDEGEFGCPFTG